MSREGNKYDVCDEVGGGERLNHCSWEAQNVDGVVIHKSDRMVGVQLAQFPSASKGFNEMSQRLPGVRTQRREVQRTLRTLHPQGHFRDFTG